MGNRRPDLSPRDREHATTLPLPTPECREAREPARSLVELHRLRSPDLQAAVEQRPSFMVSGSCHRDPTPSAGQRDQRRGEVPHPGLRMPSKRGWNELALQHAPLAEEPRSEADDPPLERELRLLTFNEELVELVTGDLEVVVEVVEVQKDVQDVVVVVAVDPPVGAAGRLGVRRRRKRAR